MWKKVSLSMKNRLHDAADLVGSWTGRVTGVQKLEHLKANVNEAYKKLGDVKLSFAAVKNQYYSVVESRSASQLSVNNLLQRKSKWSADDVTQFTEAVSKEHEYENEERTAKQRMIEYEDLIEKLQKSYEDAVRDRYQEELLVAERNRGISNILTWSLMLANLGMFAISQLVVEPYRRLNIRNAVRVEMEQAVGSIQADYSSMLAALSTLSDTIKQSSSHIDEMPSKAALRGKDQSSTVGEKLSIANSNDTVVSDGSATQSSLSSDMVTSPSSQQHHATVVNIAIFFGFAIVSTFVKSNR